MKVKTNTVLYLTQEEFDCLERACELCRDIEVSVRTYDHHFRCLSDYYRLTADMAEDAKDALESLLDSLEGGECVDSL